VERFSFATLRAGSLHAAPAWRATEQERHGALQPTRAEWLVRNLDPEDDRATLVGLYRLTTGVEPHDSHRMVVPTLVSKICAALEAGRLLLLSDEIGPDAADASTIRPTAATVSRELRLISSLMSGRPALSFEGVRYRLVPVEGQARARWDTEYGPVPADEAGDLVKRIAEATAKTPAERALWAEVADAVARANDQARIVLLRPRPAVVVPVPIVEAAAPAAPSRAPVGTQSWIEIQLEFEDGTPFPGSCLIELPGGHRSEGPPDELGTIRMDRIDPGTCKISFPTPAS
jgi:hypothetical protein